MAKVSKTSAAHVNEYGPITDRFDEADGHRISLVTFDIEADGAPLLKGLPNDQCQAPHWGYVVRGTTTFRFSDHDEVFEAGDAFYVGPGHTPFHTQGSELVLFSQTELMKETEAAMQRNMAAMHSH